MDKVQSTNAFWLGCKCALHVWQNDEDGVAPCNDELKLQSITDDISVSNAEYNTDSDSKEVVTGVANCSEIAEEVPFKCPQHVLFEGNILNPPEITRTSSEFEGLDCFTKGCKWSPDGTCILTNSNDNSLRLWDLPTSFYNKTFWSNKNPTSVDLKPAVKVQEGGLVYDYCWYPVMSSWEPSTCCFATVSRGSPGHLWDAFTGSLRATYRVYNQVDEVEAAQCVAFDPTGERLYFGFNNNIRLFRTDLPGREYTTRNLRTVSCDCQCGIVSCITVCPSEPNLYAVGTYLKTIGLYSEMEEKVLCVLRGHDGGLTHLRFSPDGTRLYSGARMDSEILCWDLREPGKVLFTIPRKVTTHQRIYFDLTSDGRYLVSGLMDGSLSVWDTENLESGNNGVLQPVKTFKAHEDCTNGVSVHPYYTILASCSGQRHFISGAGFSDSENSSGEDDILENSKTEEGSCRKRLTSNLQRDFSLKLWWSGAIDEETNL